MQKSGKSNTEEEEAGESEGLLADATTNSDMGNMAVLFDKSPPRLEFQNTSGDSDESPKVEIVNGTPSETQRWKLMQLQGLSSRCGVLRRFKIKVWLTLLFVLMVVTVCIVIHFYKQDMVEVDIGNALRFYIDSRRLHVDRGDATDVLTARLGDSIPRNLLPFNCLGAGEDPRTRLCMEWRGQARLSVRYRTDGGVDCYDVAWIAERAGASLRDCVSLAPAHWYGGGLVAGQPWPLERWSRPPRPYVGGDARRGEYGGVLERYWLSSRGAYVRAGDDAPLVVSVNDGGDGDLCLAAPSPGACGVAGEATTLTYSVCVAGDARLAHEHYLSRAPRPACVPRDAVSRVVWTTDSGLDGEADGEAATRLAEGVSRRGGGGGVVVVAGWEARPGDLAFDARRFPDPRAVVAAIAARNLSVALRVRAVAAVGSPALAAGAARGYWVRDGGGTAPGLSSRGRGAAAAAVLDPTDPGARGWWVRRLRELGDGLGVAGFAVAGGEVSALPHAHRLADPSTSDVGYVGAFVRMLQQLSAPRNESEGEESKVVKSTTEESEGGQSEEEDSERVASHKQESAAVADTCGRIAIVSVDVGSRTQFLAAPMAGVSLPPSWSLGLAAIIPTALTVGLLGYPLAMAPPLRAESSQRPPDAELYLRWLQAAACLPALQLALPPWTYSEAVEEAAYKALRFREEVVLPRVLASLEGAARDLRAVARPLWWDAPRDEAAQVVDSEFLVGDDLLVAPVVTSGAPAIRDIYLPAGRWRDGLAGGSTISGPTWLRRYSVPLESIPHFTRVR